MEKVKDLTKTRKTPRKQLENNRKQKRNRHTMKSVQALRVLRGYRRALRATERVFAGDENIHVARRYVRDQFRVNAEETDQGLIGTIYIYIHPT